MVSGQIPIQAGLSLDTFGSNPSPASLYFFQDIVLVSLLRRLD